jgi:hypothetical protein
MCTGIQVGGNRKFLEFCAKYNLPKAMGIKDKYNTAVAASYKERIKALSEVRCSIDALTCIETHVSLLSLSMYADLGVSWYLVLVLNRVAIGETHQKDHWIQSR